MKKIFTLIAAVALGSNVLAQAPQNYCDFEGTKSVTFREWNGILDSNATNVYTNAINMSSKCGKYIRDTALYDNLKFFAYTKFGDISQYATTSATALKFTMKVWCSAAVGTSINLQMGWRHDKTYPASIHSEYTAKTTVTRAWELVTFKYLQNPANGYPYPGSIDKMVILLNPGTHARDTMYFDDPTGAAVEPPTGLNENRGLSYAMSQNQPNPAIDKTTIGIELNTAGNVSLKLFDVLGKPVMTLVDGPMNAGSHNIELNTAILPSGIYFYEFKKGDSSKAMKMIVTK